MSRIIKKELIILGGGPAGLRAGMDAGLLNLDYIILEQGGVGQAWRNIRPDLKLLSPSLPQRDWTSLSNKFPIWKLKVQRPYCTAAEFINYLDAFTDHYQLDMSLNNSVTKVEKHDDYFSCEAQDGSVYQAPVLLNVTGILGNPYFPDIPGLLNNPYISHSDAYLSKNDFINKRVLIVGGGNGAAEIAIDLAGTAMVYMVTREKLSFFSQTKKLYHIRGISESYLKELIAMEIIRYRGFEEIHKIKGNVVCFDDREQEFDHIVFATGYRAHLKVLESFKLRVNRYSFPDVSASGESVQYPNLYFGGPLAYYGPASSVMHGFIRKIPKTMKRISEVL